MGGVGLMGGVERRVCGTSVVLTADERGLCCCSIGVGFGVGSGVNGESAEEGFVVPV